MATYAGRYDEVLLRKAGNRLAPAAANTTVQVYESDGTTAASGNAVQVLNVTLDRLAVFFDRFADLLQMQYGDG